MHICGDTTNIVDDMTKSGADIIDLDWKVDYAKAAETFGRNGPALCGNFDPVKIMLHSTPDEVYNAVTNCLVIGSE